MTLPPGKWPTPRAEDSESSGGRNLENAAHPGMTLIEAARKAAWVTPAERDYKDSPGMATERPDGSRDRFDQLPRQAQLSAWPTPNTMEGGQTSRSGDRKGEPLMGGIIKGLAASGTTPSGSHAATGSPGQLAPTHSRWVMGYEIEHLNCAPTETRSSLKSRLSSSPRIWHADHDGTPAPA